MKMKFIRPLVQIPVRTDGIKAEKFGNVLIQFPSTRLGITDDMTATVGDLPPTLLWGGRIFPPVIASSELSQFFTTPGFEQLRSRRVNMKTKCNLDA